MWCDVTSGEEPIGLLEQLGPSPGMHLLDVGSGPGGASRFAAAQYGCDVTGVDMTPEYVELAMELAERMALGGRVSYPVADACDLPFGPGVFDGATASRRRSTTWSMPSTAASSRLWR